MKEFSSRILIITERDNAEKDRELISALVEDLGTLNCPVLFYPGAPNTSRFLDPHGRFDRLPVWLRKPIKALRLLGYPGHWGYFLKWRKNGKGETIEKQAEKLKRFVKKVGVGREVIILSRSAGGRAASMVADNLGVKKLICIGYPFKHPEEPTDPNRYAHLQTLHTPFLILQGERDSYGGREVKTVYPLSPSVSFAFFDADHDFVLSSQEWQRCIELITHFIEA